MVSVVGREEAVSEELERLAQQLRDTQTGWVARRDAAQALGKAVSFALDALREYSDEMDVDVRRAVDQALGEASAALAGVPARPPVRQYTLEELAIACAKDGERVVAPHGKGYVVQVTLKSGRHQAVFLNHHVRKDGAELIRVFTVCGKPRADAFEWALRANMKISLGALALTGEGDEERMVLTNRFLARAATPSQIKASVKELAVYGDWIESKLGELDDF
ncbi:MAG TPA: hypothetical protein PKW60_00255 [Candidatus Hydrogenedentes bacterium]|jgi:predicted heme/steroid binding protein|nr:hypothetical protein [Candidatus Hydrogenedentota bacterium]